MRIGYHGEPTNAPTVRLCHIGCGSHSRRNVLPALKFCPAEPVAICDLDAEKAEAFAREFGFPRAYADYIEMIEAEKPDAVCVVVGYDAQGRPRYPAIARECLARGVHVWVEKPPAATSAALEDIRALCARTGKQFAVGFKKMYFPANVKAKALSEAESFGGIALATLSYPQYVPARAEFDRYASGENVGAVVGFLDHLCHPVSLLHFLLGAPDTLHYARAASGAGLATFTFASGATASIAFTHGAATNGGMERTLLLGRNGGHITVENNLRVTLHRDPPGLHYGASPSFYLGDAESASAVWEPEFSLGQLYNKGLFLLGYQPELEAFLQSILQGRAVSRAGVEDAIAVTRVFEAFFEGEGRVIRISKGGACA